MSQSPSPSHDPVARRFAAAALCASLLALVFAMTGPSAAKTTRPAAKAKPPTATRVVASSTPKANGVLRLDKYKRFPASVIPKVAAAKSADKLGGATRLDLVLACGTDQVDIGTWCLDSSTYAVPPADIGKNDYFYASIACEEQGGYLPSAAQLIGAAKRAKLSGTIDQDETSASVDIDPTDGLRDQREMSSTLFTTDVGGAAAGSEGVTPGSKGDPKQAIPDPQPIPADPSPSTLDYVTVYDNHNLGGFAGGQPVGQAERFRCAADKAQGGGADAIG